MNTLIKRYLSFSIGIWIRPIISFITVPIVSWLIDPSEFGKASMYSTFYSILTLVTLFGTSNAFMRFYFQKSEEERNELLWSCLSIPLILWMITSVVLFVFRYQINSFLIGTKDANVHILLSAKVLVGILQNFNLSVIRMRGRGLIYSFLLMLESISYAAFILVFAFCVSRNFYAILYAQLFSVTTSLILGILLERNYWFPVRIRKNLISEVVKYSYPFVFTGLLWWLLTWIDRIVLRMYVDFNEIGLYSTAFKLASIVSLFSSGFSTIWQPYAYEYFENNPENKGVFSKVFDYVSFGVFSLGFLVLVFKDIVFLLFSQSYRSAASISPFLLLSPIMLALAAVVARGIDFAKKTYWYIISDGSAALFNVMGNFLLVPTLGAKGAAISTGLSMIIVFTIEYLASVRYYPVKYKIGRVYTIFAIFIVISWINTFYGGVFSVASALFGIVITLVFYKNEFVILSRKIFDMIREKLKI
jgi:O-antigen/teichoic acid export membrane protein